MILTDKQFEILEKMEELSRNENLNFGRTVWIAFRLGELYNAELNKKSVISDEYTSDEKTISALKGYLAEYGGHSDMCEFVLTGFYCDCGWELISKIVETL